MIDAYMKQAQRFNVLTREEEQTIAQRYKRTHRQRYRDALINHNLRFVVQQAHKFVGYLPGHLEDLVQEGNVGLLIAAEKFDPDRGFRFITYAVWWVRARMTIYVVVNRSLVKIGSTQADRALFTKVHELYAQVKQENPDLERTEILEEISRRVDYRPDEVERIYHRTSTRDVSLDEVIATTGSFNNGSESATHKDRLEDLRPLADEVIERADQMAAVAQLIWRAKLNDRDRFLVEHRLLSDDPMTLADLGRRFGVSRERVRQIETNLLSRLATVALSLPKSAGSLGGEVIKLRLRIERRREALEAERQASQARLATLTASRKRARRGR